MKLSEHFDSEEFDCHGGNYCECGGCGEQMNLILIRALEKLRSDCGGYPLHINSGYRCQAWNTSPWVNGAPSSQHCYFCAADVQVPIQLTIGEFKWYAEQTQLFDGIGIYPREFDGDYGDLNSRYGWIHLDVRSNGTEPNTYQWGG